MSPAYILPKVAGAHHVTSVPGSGPGPLFARRGLIKLTDKGRNIARLQYLSEQRVVDIIFRVFNDEEMDTFIKLIKKI